MAQADGDHTQGQWEFWIDRGGTFTDIIGKNPDQQLLCKKLLSDNPRAYDDAALQGIRDLLGLSINAPIPPELVRRVKMGTTVATNALLERKGQATVLLITQGLRDVLEIGYQVRPKTFALEVVKPKVLYSQVIEISERMAADGEVILGLNEQTAKQQLDQAYAQGYRSAAIVLLHAYRYPQHEQQLAKLAAQAGFEQISVSHQVSATMRIVPRGDTTVVDAYLSPVLRRYVNQVAKALRATSDNLPNVGPIAGNKLQFMRSSGGLTAADKFQGRDAILSGPAGGIIGAVHTSELAGFGKIIGFDMGGTSTDVSHYAGSYERAFETEVAGVRMSVPMMSVHTVAAGGGSILHFDQSRYRVGPDSAGATPGPKCYRNGGPLTVTDANVCLGKINPEYFPKLFGPKHDQGIDLQAVHQAFDALAQQLPAETSGAQVAEGFLQIAIEHMAQAIKKISVERGYDVQHYALTCFGGAGGQHACLVAERLGMQTILIHPFASIMSAYGMGLADIRSQSTKSYQQPLEQAAMRALGQEFEGLRQLTSQEIYEQGVATSTQDHQALAFLRYADTDTTLPIELGAIDQMRAQFEAAHLSQYGFIASGKTIIIDAISMESWGGGQTIDEASFGLEQDTQPKVEAHSRIFSAGQWHPCPCYLLADICPGQQVSGPAIIIEPNGTIVVEANWSAMMNQYRHLILTNKGRVAQATETQSSDTIGNIPPALTADDHPKTRPDPVLLEVFNNQFMSIAEQMGIVLRNTSSSVNIKERLDFSCAVFDARGNLIANAPHIPVHLGSMDVTVKTLISSALVIEPGDVFIHNDPFSGGSHLPDVTVITPVFLAEATADADSDQPLFFVASRAHHADIGGLSPGSMSPEAHSIVEEGVVIPCMKMIAKGQFLQEELERTLLQGPYPVRNIAQNIADLKAQVGANHKGKAELLKLVAQRTLAQVQAYTRHIMDNAEQSVRQIIKRLKSGRYSYSMDGGLQVCVRIEVDRDAASATLDFTGTSGQQSNNFNAPAAITQAVVLYAFRCLIGSDIPLNAGCMRPLSLKIPAKSMLNPDYPAAVVAGNVEVSQALANALFGALRTEDQPQGVLGMTQGTMNNLTFGNQQYQYYETLCSGSAAGPGFNGTPGVHTHMTNSRLTDPEVLEARYPVRLDKFEINRGSGGKGKWHAGDGIHRRISFLQAMQCAIISGHRQVPLAGVNGGQSGQLGHNWLQRADGCIEELGGCAQMNVAKGDAINIQTPTGGGFGQADV